MSKRIIVIFGLLIIANIGYANPMRPDPSSSAKPVTPVKTSTVRTVPLPTLTSVLIIGDYRVASFSNGVERLLGEKLTTYTLTVIEPDHVVLTRNGRRTRLNLTDAGDLTITPVIEE